MTTTHYHCLSFRGYLGHKATIAWHQVHFHICCSDMWWVRVCKKASRSGLANGNHQCRRYHQHTKGITGRCQVGWCAACCPDREGVVSAYMESSTQVQFSPPHHQCYTDKSVSRGTSVSFAVALVFLHEHLWWTVWTGSAPLRPQCHALMPASSWMPQRCQRPSSQRALNHPAPECKGCVECHCGSHQHRSLTGPSCCHAREGWMSQWQLQHCWTIHCGYLNRRKWNLSHVLCSRKNSAMYKTKQHGSIRNDVTALQG